MIRFLGTYFLWRDALFSLCAGGRSLVVPQLDMLCFADSHGRLIPFEWRQRISGCRRGTKEVEGENERKGEETVVDM